MSWVFLLLAGVLEIVWACAMKQSQGFTKLGPSIVTVVALIGSLGLLALALRSLPLGTSYMIWTGIGAVGAFIAGVIFLDEAVTSARLLAAVMIVAGVITMKLSFNETTVSKDGSSANPTVAECTIHKRVDCKADICMKPDEQDLLVSPQQLDSDETLQENLSKI